MGGSLPYSSSLVVEVEAVFAARLVDDTLLPSAVTFLLLISAEAGLV